MKRLVIVEDQTAIREMLVEILRTDVNYKLVGESGDGQSAYTLCLEVLPDVIVLDAKLPGLNGVDLLRRLTKQMRNLRVLVFSGHENPMLVREMLEAGAHGFVEKTAGLFEFKKGLETVANGGTYFGPAVAALLRNVVANPSASTSNDFLTDREREILQLVAEKPQHQGDRFQAQHQRQDGGQPPDESYAEVESPRRGQSHSLRARDRSDRTEEADVRATRRRGPG
jgi:DNA-binding NarL/FixJ family response regulator